MAKDAKPSNKNYYQGKLKKLKSLNEQLLQAELRYHVAWMKVWESSLNQKIALTEHQMHSTHEYEEYKRLLLERRLLLLAIKYY